MLAKAIFEVGSYTGVVFAVFLDYVKVPHNISVVLPSSLRSSGQAHIGSRFSKEFHGGFVPP